MTGAERFTADHPAVRRLVAGAAAQGLPEQVTDAAALARVAAVLATPAPKAA